MSKSRLAGAVEVLMEELERKLQEASEIKRTVNSLRRTMGEEPMFSDVEAERLGVTRPDQFYGKPFATAAQDLLRLKGQACAADEILQGLQDGGFDFKATGWKKTDWLRNTAISLAKNNRYFHKLPNSTFGLLEWYPEIASRAKDNGAKEASGESVEDAASAEEGASDE